MVMFCYSKAVKGVWVVMPSKTLAVQEACLVMSTCIMVVVGVGWVYLVMFCCSSVVKGLWVVMPS